MLVEFMSILGNALESFDFGYYGINFSNLFPFIAVIPSAIIMFLPIALIIKIIRGVTNV